MAVELGDLTLERLTQVNVQERARIVKHEVPGMEGSLTQMMGRSSVVIQLVGIFHGADDAASNGLDGLRQVYLAGDPVDFYTEATGTGYFAQVVITKLDVMQRAGFLDQFDYKLEISEYIEPPEPISIDPLSAIDSSLLDEAAAFMDDVQNAIDAVSQLADLVAAIPDFGDPTEGIGDMVTEYSSAAEGVVTALQAIDDLF